MTRGIWKEKCKLVGHKEVVRNVAFSPDSDLLASVSAAGHDGTVRLWNIHTTQQVRHMDVPSTCVAFSPDGRLLAAGYYPTLYLWDISSIEKPPCQLAIKDGVTSIAFSQDTTVLAYGSRDGKIRLWDIERMREIRTYNPKTIPMSLAFSPHDHFLIAGGGDGTIYLWETNPSLLNSILGSMRTLKPHRQDAGMHLPQSYNKILRDMSQMLKNMTGPNPIACSSDGKTLASTGTGNLIRLWDLSNRRQIRELQGHSETINSLCFSPDGLVLASADRFDVLLWDIVSGTRLTHSVDVKGHDLTVALSPNGRYLAIGAEYDNCFISIWELDA